MSTIAQGPDLLLPLPLFLDDALADIRLHVFHSWSLLHDVVFNRHFSLLFFFRCDVIAAVYIIGLFVDGLANYFS